LLAVARSRPRADRVAGGAMGLAFFVRLETACRVRLLAAVAIVMKTHVFECAEYKINLALIA